VLFNSFQFLIFYVVVVSVFFAIPHRFRWMLLLAASYYFYMCWKAEYVVLIVAATVINYGAALGIERSDRALVRRLLLTGSVGASLGILFTYKYLDFFGQSVRSALASVDVFVDVPLFELILPLGISFYTFQSLGYTIDVYRGAVPAERHLGIFALYVSLFPQLGAGPIERSANLLPQFRVRHEIDLTRAAEGLRLMLWGMFKKVVIADQVAAVVDTVYAAPEEFTGPILILATVAFAVQIYCDFSGYSDIAIGSARILGYDLMRNFRQPYLATSVADFWRRWHISLSTWFRDYVYVPLGGNRVTRGRWHFNIAMVFVLSGVWHGANWTFVVWGALHAAFMIASSWSEGPRAALVRACGLSGRPALHRFVSIAITCLLVLVAWTFFRAESVGDAIYVLRHAFDFQGFRVASLWALGLPRFEMVVTAANVVVLWCVDAALEQRPAWVVRAWERRPIRWALYLASIYAVIFFGVFGQVEFIYFQF